MTKRLTITTALTSALLALPGCTSGDDWDDNVYADRDTSVCVDREGRRVYDDNCRGGYTGGSGGGYSHYYISRNSPVPFYGESVFDSRYAGSAGSFTPQPGRAYAQPPSITNMTRSQAVSRGGLGSSARGFGGGRS